MHCISLKNFIIGQGHPLTIMCGPCVIESEEMILHAAETLKKIFSRFPVNFIFKSSFDKANRFSIDSFRGPGIQEGLRILEKVKKEFDLPILTDIHLPEQASAIAEVCDILQIPAFLCRQTDLVVAAAQTGKIVNIKKGQFVAPGDMKNIVKKVRSVGNEDIILIDRGFSFGYNNLVSDMRAIPIMQDCGVPVFFDATHSVQLPGGQGTSSGGQREFIPVLAKAAVAVGANGLYLEAHPDPKNAKSDAGAQLSFNEVAPLMDVVTKIYEIVQASN